MVDNFSRDCPISFLNDAFCSSLKGLSNDVFKLTIVLLLINMLSPPCLVCVWTVHMLWKCYKVDT